MFAKFDEISSMILEVIKETKRYGHTDGRSVGQRENSIPSHKHSLRGYNKCILFCLNGIIRGVIRKFVEKCYKIVLLLMIAMKINKFKLFLFAS